MTLQPIMHDFDIQFLDADRGENRVLQSTIVCHPSETEEQLVARLLAYILYYESDLEFVTKTGAGDEPELWLRGADDKVVHWVDVGLPERDRLINASRHAQRVGLVAWGKALRNWELQHILNLRGVPNLSVISVNQDFINSLVTRSSRSYDGQPLFTAVVCAYVLAMIILRRLSRSVLEYATRD